MKSPVDEESSRARTYADFILWSNVANHHGERYIE